MVDTNDLVTKDFEAYPDVAADIINVLIYQGEGLVDKDNLLPAPTESIYQGKDALHDQFEDVEKYEMQGGKPKALYLFANQTKRDAGMLLRKAGYVGAAYREQYDGKIRNACPVIEVILYWGEGKWQGKRTMRRLFQKSKLPEAAWDYIDDMKLHVFEMRRLPAEVRQRFTSDMRIVVDYLAEGDRYRSDRKVAHKAALIKMIRVLSGDQDVEDTEAMLEKMQTREEDEITVCELFEQYRRQGIKEGIQEGVKEGIKALVITCKELGVSFDETAEKVKVRYQLKDKEVQENMTLFW